MQVTQKIRCPNCGNIAERHHLSGREAAESGCPDSQLTRVECAACDYFIATCALNGSVVEAYAPGTYTLNDRSLALAARRLLSLGALRPAARSASSY